MFRDTSEYKLTPMPCWGYYPISLHDGLDTKRETFSQLFIQFNLFIFVHINVTIKTGTVTKKKPEKLKRGKKRTTILPLLEGLIKAPKRHCDDLGSESWPPHHTLVLKHNWKIIDASSGARKNRVYAAKESTEVNHFQN